MDTGARFFCCVGVCFGGLLWALMSIQSRNSYAGNRSRGRPIAHLNTTNLRECVKTHVIFTPGALLVGCLPQFVLHFAGIDRIRWIRGRAQKSIFEQ